MPTYREFKQKIQDSFSTSFWLRDALQQLDQRDPVDALNDARFLAELMQLRLRDHQQGVTR